MGKRFVVLGFGKFAHRHNDHANRIGMQNGVNAPNYQKSLEIKPIYRKLTCYPDQKKPIVVKSSKNRHQDFTKLEDTSVTLPQVMENGFGRFPQTINSNGRNMVCPSVLIGENGTIKIGRQYMDILEYENMPGLQPYFSQGSHIPA